MAVLTCSKIRSCGAAISEIPEFISKSVLSKRNGTTAAKIALAALSIIAALGIVVLTWTYALPVLKSGTQGSVIAFAAMSASGGLALGSIVAPCIVNEWPQTTTHSSSRTRQLCEGCLHYLHVSSLCALIGMMAFGLCGLGEGWYFVSEAHRPSWMPRLFFLR